MKSCIFEDYFKDGKECDMDYNCDECSTKYAIREVVMRESKKQEGRGEDKP